MFLHLSYLQLEALVINLTSYQDSELSYQSLETFSIKNI